MPPRRKARIISACKSSTIFINGKFVAPKAGSILIRSTRPRKQNWLPSLEAGADDVDLAVKAARQAYEQVWSKLPAREQVSTSFASRIMQGVRGNWR